MSSLQLILAYLRAKPLQALLNVLLLALGVATIVFALATTRQLERGFTRDLAGIDLVVGAKGSPLQIILSGVFHLDVPTGNIPLAQADALRRNPLIAKAIPLSLGDSYAGFRIVGTELAYLEHYAAQLAQGRGWAATLEAVAGADTALTLGARFAGVHGLGAGGHAHTDTPYTVVGVLKRCGCVLDRLILTNLESVWQVHETAVAEDESDKKILAAEREITLLLLRYASPMAAAILPRQINAQSELQAASPAFETARLMRMVGTGSELLQLFGWVLMAASGIALFVAMLGALNERKADLAMLRMLGAGRGKLARLLLGEALLLALAGFVLGWLIGQGLTAVLSYSVQTSQGGHASVDFAALLPHLNDLAVLGGTLGVAVLACAAPLRQLYKLDVALTLTDTA